MPWPRIGLIEAIEPVTKESLHTLSGAFPTAFGYLLYTLLVLHVGGALERQWLDRQPGLQRMALQGAGARDAQAAERADPPARR